MRVARIMRASVIDTLGRATSSRRAPKGLTRAGRSSGSHVLRNSSLPLVTIAGYAFGAALGGAVLLETVFTWPGLGLLLVEAIRLRRQHDGDRASSSSPPLAVVAMNLIVDLLYALLDPRIRNQR